jgi:exodeoxyribonuclease III
MKIITYNVNSIRKRLPLLLDWAAQHHPDVMCLQETKVQDRDFPVKEVEDAGYYVAFRGMRSYNGVATLSRKKPEQVIYGLHEGPDNEDFRIIQTVIDGIPIINTYVPQGSLITSEKYVLKLAWFKRLHSYFKQHLDPAKPAIWLGDLNVAPEPIDVFHPEQQGDNVAFHVDVRNVYKEILDWGFVDVFRKLNPDRVQYTYWDYFGIALRQNWGWRIDHILATAPLAVRCRHADIDAAPRKAPNPSDHTIAWAEFD